MKKIIFALACLIVATTCYSQTPETPMPSQAATKGSKEYYLEKREANMVRGWILTPTGVGLMGLGIIMGWAEVASSVITFGQDEPDYTGAGLVTAAGFVAVIVGTTSFISAGHNKRKARAVAVGYDHVPLPQQGALMTKAVPMVSFKISF